MHGRRSLDPERMRARAQSVWRRKQADPRSYLGIPKTKSQLDLSMPKTPAIDYYGLWQKNTTPPAPPTPPCCGFLLPHSLHWPFRAFSWALASRAARTNGESCDRSTHCFMKSCCARRQKHIGNRRSKKKKIKKNLEGREFWLSGIGDSPAAGRGRWRASPGLP